MITVIRPPGNLTPLWPHQDDAVQFIQERRGSLLHLPMGSGKSRITLDAMDLLVAMRTNPFTVVIVTPPPPVTEVWPFQMGLYVRRAWTCALIDTGSVRVRADTIARAQAIALRETQGRLVIVTNYEAVFREPLATALIRLRPNMLVMDECVPAGTMILTPTGAVPIESVQIGDEVIGFDDHHSVPTVVRVRRTMRRSYIGDLVRVADTWLTPGHPIWRGQMLDSLCYIELRHLHGNVFCDVRVVRTTHDQDSERRTAFPLLRQELLGAVATRDLWPSPANCSRTAAYASSHASDSRAAGRHQQIAEASLRTIESPARSANPSQGCARAAAAWVLDVERRQWTSLAQAAASFVASAGTSLEQRGGGCVGGPLAWSANELQDRCGSTFSADRDRVRWALPQISYSANARCEEGSRTEATRLDDPAFYEPADHVGSGRRLADGVVYNLETESGNYVANGLLVHNCHKLKAPGGKTSNYLARLATMTTDRIVGLSGTAMPNGPLDLYGQARAIAPRAFPEAINPVTRRPVYSRFRARYAIVDTGGPFPIIRGYQRGEEFAACAATFMLRMEKSEILKSLPPELDVVVPISLEAGTRRIYDQLTKELVAEIEDGLITASNGAVKLLRLAQLTSGFSKVEKAGEPTLCRLHEAKTTALTELFADLPPHEPIVVFARFIEDLNATKRAAIAAGREYAEISGAVKQLDEWRAAHAEPSVLGVQIQAGGLGIDLTRACYAVYFSATFDRAVYEQSRARVHRPGQTRPVTYFHLVARGTVDSYVYRALKKKGDIVEECLRAIASAASTSMTEMEVIAQ